MKKFIVILFFVLIPCIISAQIKSNDVVVAAVNLNVLYRGIANPVAIAVSGVPSSKVSAEISDGKIEKLQSGWSVNPGNKDECLIRVLVDGDQVAEMPFRVKNIPVPVAVLMGVNNGTVSKQKLMENSTLEAVSPDFLWDLHFTITGFTLLKSEGGYDFEEEAKGNRITDKMKVIIENMERGRNIILKDIVAVGPDGKTIKLNPVIIRLE